MVSQMLQNSTTCTFIFNNIYLCSTRYIYIQQYAFSFNFNPNYFRSTKIFVQLQPEIITFNNNRFVQPKLFSFNKNNYSTSTKNNFIKQQSSRTFKISSFNKMPRPSHGTTPSTLPVWKPDIRLAPKSKWRQEHWTNIHS